MLSPLPDELVSVATSPRLRRYLYFINEVATTKKVWTLYKDRWAIAETYDYQLFPLWPDKPFAEICAIKQWKHYRPMLFTLDIFLSEVMQMLDNSLLFPSIFDTPYDSGTVINTQLLKDDLLEAQTR